MLTNLNVPKATPAKKVSGYQMPDDEQSLVSWAFVVEQMSQSRQYWLTTIFKNGRPHAVPIWGIWLSNRFFFGGSLQTAWGKNILHSPDVVVHLPSAEKVVILHGTIQIIDDDVLAEREWQRLDQTFQEKYQVEDGSPYICVHPRKILAWDGEDLTTMTRWQFR